MMLGLLFDESWQPYIDVAWFLAWLIGGVLAVLLLGVFWNRLLIPLTRKTSTKLDNVILATVKRPVQVVVFMAAIALGFHICLAGLMKVLPHPAWGIARGVIYVALVLALTWAAYAAVRAVTDWYFGRLVGEAAEKTNGHLASLFRKIVKVVFFFVALTIIFEHFQVKITGLLATAGIASLAVALAAQETLANWIAGLALLIDRPFRVGDRIQLANGQMGDVLEIGLRTTRVLSFDNTVITIPNSEVAKSQIINLNAPDANVKIRCNLGVAYGTDLRKAKQILKEVMIGHAEVLREPAPSVFFTEFGESALNLLFICWVADYREKFRIQDELNMAIKDCFEAEGVEIPFPQRDVHVRFKDRPPAGL